MPIIFAILGLLFPRVLIIVLWLFTAWFRGVFDTLLWPILGFLFFPVATLWYSVVVNYYGGMWSAVPIIGMVIAVVVDTGSWRSSRRLARDRRGVG